MQQIAPHIVPYRPEYKEHFERLNKAWLEEYFTVEPIDEFVLTQPEKAILSGGGRILFALLGDTVIGTVALRPAGPGIYELTKMAVDKAFRGKGAGEQLCRAALREASCLGAQKVILYSQTGLQAAIGIYRKLGFSEIALETGKYRRADIKMELALR